MDTTAVPTPAASSCSRACTASSTSEPVANSVTLGGQTSPAVASLGSAGFVIAWAGAFDNSTGQSIRYQLYDATGAPVSYPEYKVVLLSGGGGGFEPGAEAGVLDSCCFCRPELPS